MELNADFSERVAVHWDDGEWLASPMPGVSRHMLDRIGDEVARATTIVRYDPNSRFPAHVHGGGEEFIVLEGVFQDELGDYPAGYYVRNPPQSRHTPGSDSGCLLFVKLWQFDPEDRAHIRIDSNRIGAVPAADRPFVAITPLYSNTHEDVRIERWQPGATVTVDTDGGVELFVLEGGFEESGEMFERYSWLRLPDSAPATAKAGAEGARIWIKSGHLHHAKAPESG